VAIALLLLLALAATACSAPAPTRSPAPTDFTLHPFPGLEAHFPTHVAGETLVTTSLRPSADTTSPKTQALLVTLGATIDDLQLGSAQASGVDISITALRVKGIDARQTLAAIQQVDEADPAHIAVYGRAIIVGKTVVTRTVSGTVFYDDASGDIVFEVSGAPAPVQEVLGQIP
jgi:hypothetical protein